MRDNYGPDAIEKWIAAREHDDASASPGEDRRNCLSNRGRPYQALACRQAGEFQMPRPAHNEIGLGDEPPRNRRETVKTVLTDADEREPFLAGAHAAISACAF
jgi:hypothetical protein